MSLSPSLRNVTFPKVKNRFPKAGCAINTTALSSDQLKAFELASKHFARFIRKATDPKTLIDKVSAAQPIISSVERLSALSWSKVDIVSLEISPENFDFSLEPKKLAGQIVDWMLDEILTQIYASSGFLEETWQWMSKVPAIKDLYPLARKQKREIVFHCGPTNSGKTHSAIREILKTERKACYLAPLRLLALEVYETINESGIACNLHTGEEYSFTDGANITSSTCEIFNPEEEYDLVVIDEFQLVADPKRGFAWLRALLGANAKKIIVIGSTESELPLKEICDYTKETYEKKVFTRKTEIEFTNEGLDLSQKQPPNTAFVAFSKKEVLRIAHDLMSKGNTVATVYGAMPPEVRRFEGKQFSEGKVDCIVATDVIGLGLNLPISRIVLTATQKYDGFSVKTLTPMHTRQVAGRAGRMGYFNKGIVSATSEGSLKKLQKLYYREQSLADWVPQVRLTDELANEIIHHLNPKDYAGVLSIFQNNMKFDFGAAPFLGEHSLDIARMIYRQYFSVSEAIQLVYAPISDDASYHFFCDVLSILHDARQSGQGITYGALLEQCANSSLETSIRLLDILAWFTFNFAEFQPMTDSICELKKTKEDAWISKILKTRTPNSVNQNDRKLTPSLDEEKKAA